MRAHWAAFTLIESECKGEDFISYFCPLSMNSTLNILRTYLLVISLSRFLLDHYKCFWIKKYRLYFIEESKSCHRYKSFAGDDKERRDAAKDLLQGIAETYVSDYKSQSGSDIPELAFFHEVEEVRHNFN